MELNVEWMAMEIYVQSSGVGLEHGYRWLRITENFLHREEPPLASVSNLIENEAYSVVLARLPNQQLLLLITSIEAKDRRDIFYRQIYISVAWVGKDSDELILRRLAARALDENEQKSVAADINRSVTLGGDNGFHVSFQNIARLVETKQEPLGSEPPNVTNKIGRNSQNLKNSLAAELKKCHLPKREAPLVVVTGVKERDILEKAEVWRGLSSLVETETWEPISHSLFFKVLKFLKYKIWESIPRIFYKAHI